MARVSAVLSSLVCAAVVMLADGATWISYPGDYAIWRGNEFQVKRNEHGGGIPTFWATYAHHYTVDFVKEVEIEKDCVAEIHVDGVARIWCGDDNHPLDGLISNKIALAAGKYKLGARIYNSKHPPSLYIKGPYGLNTDGSWTADWRIRGAAAHPEEPALSVEADPRFDAPERPPASFKLVTRREEPVKVERLKGNHILADFGRETFGFVILRDVSKAGKIRLVYGESEPEAREEDPLLTDSWEIFDVPKGDFRIPISRGFRYVHAIPEDPALAIGGIAMDFEWLPLGQSGSFRCDDAELNRIWDVSAYTLSLTLREILVEGAKRDRWTWSGDAYQSYLMNYYLTGEPFVAKEAIWYLRGGDPVVMHMNGIMDYTYYWFVSIRDYWMFTGDRTFLNQIWPKMVSMMDWVLGRLDANGRPHDRPGDWVFVDWAPESLHNNGGVVSFEQMLLVRALESLADVGAAIDAPAAAIAAYRARAAKLRAEIVPKWWSAERGALMHLLKDDGTLDGQLTRYPNMFGLAWGYFDEAQRESVLKNVIFNDSVMKIQTPYMRFYELESLLALGKHSDVMREMKSYWGGMLKEGATTFWELYNPEEKGAAKYAMYGRPYGKSLCHAWGASPIYLLGRYYLGVEPTAPGFSEYMVKPQLGGLKWMSGSVPTPSGPVAVSVSNGVVAVTGNASGAGTLVWNGRTVAIPAGKTVRIDATLSVDDKLPAGNVIVDKIAGNVVSLRQDLRGMRKGEGWFYWAFRVKGAAGKTVTFKFTDPYAGGPVGLRGPVVSLDRGKTYAYPLDGKSKKDEFTYAFAADADEVWFYECHPYLQSDWDAFLARHAAWRGKALATGVLCKSKKGRSVEKAVLGCLKDPKYTVLVTSRHHASESVATFVLEGFAGAVLADDGLGEWLRANVQVLCVPFVDKDGVEEGEQGKNRAPHDHNRDYTEFVHPETKALTEWIKAQTDNRLDVWIDFHCPWIRGRYNEFVYSPFKRDDNHRNRAAEERFDAILERLQTSGLNYKASDDLPYGQSWNNGGNYAAGWSAIYWAVNKLSSLELGHTFEIPFATANGSVVTPAKCRVLGRDIAAALREFLNK